VSEQALLDLIAEAGVHSVRVVFTDQHGALRGKSISAAAMPAALERGIGVPASLLHKDTGGVYAIDLWKPTGDATLDALVGARNIVMRPDPDTVKLLPWAEGTAVVLSDLESVDGEPIRHSTRQICAEATNRLHDRGLAFVAGLELEFHLYRVAGNGRLEQTHAGWDLLGEETLDIIEPAVEPIRRGLTALGIPPTTIEVELGPSQVEMTFAPAVGLAVADQAVLVRSAIRQIARRHGHRASFMCRPKVGTTSFPSGWHLHQSLVDRADPTGTSLFVPPDDSRLLSDLGRRYVAGLLAHAAASCMLTTPTITGYRRYRPNAIAPDRVSWSREHRGAMLRVVGGPGDRATRVENRIGDPAANPYLYIASQVLSGLDGIEAGLEPPAPTESPYEPTGGDLLPRSLGEAIDAFGRSGFYRRALGDDVVAYLTTLKQSEWKRFEDRRQPTWRQDPRKVTDWEQREYFGQF
jgi:glutamine synthetase